jgi:hypothetical protein
MVAFLSVPLMAPAVPGGNILLRRLMHLVSPYFFSFSPVAILLYLLYIVSMLQ